MLTIVSPSSSMWARTVPCIAGCEGPRFSAMRRRGSSASSGSLTAVTARSGWATGRVRQVDEIARQGARAADQVGDVALGDQRLARAGRVVLAERMALEVLRHVEPAQVGVPLELDALEIIDVPLPPVGGAPDARHRIEGGVLFRKARAQPQAVVERERG